MLKIIYNFLRRRYWIYLFPGIMDFSVAFLILLSLVKAIRLGATPFTLGILGSTWGVSYFISTLILSRFANKKKANLFIVLGCLFFIIIAPCFVFFHSLTALFLMAFLCNAATAFFFIGFQLFMGEGANLPVLKNTSFYVFGWAVGIAFGYLVSGFLADLPALISVLPVMASSLLVVAGMRLIRKFSAVGHESGEKEKCHFSSGLDKTVSPEMEKAYLFLGWTETFVNSFISSGLKFLIPKLVIDFFGRSAAVAGGMIFILFILQGLFGLFLMKFPDWRYNLKVHSRLELLSLAGVFVSMVISGLAGVVILTVVFGVYAGHAFYNGVFYSLCQQSKSGRNISINESLVGISNILGPVVLGAALQFGVEYFFLIPVLLIAIPCFIQIFLFRSLQHQS